MIIVDEDNKFLTCIMFIFYFFICIKIYVSNLTINEVHENNADTYYVSYQAHKTERKNAYLRTIED